MACPQLQLSVPAVPASHSVPCSAPGSPLHSHWESAIISQKPQQSDSKGLGIPPPWGSCDGAPPPSPPVRPEDRPPGPHRSHNTPSSAFGSQGFPFKQDRQATSSNEIPSHSFQKPLLPPLLIWQNFLADIYSKGYPVSRLSSVPCLLGFAPWMTHLNTSCNYPLSGPCVRPTADALPSPGCLLCSAGKATCHNHQFIPPTHYTGPMRRNVCLKPVDCSELGRKPLAFPGTHIVCLSLPSCSLNAKPGLTGPHQIIWWWTAVSGILAIISITSQLSMYQILSGFTIFTQLHSQRRTILQCKKLHLPYRWEYWSSGNRCWAQEGLGIGGRQVWSTVVQFSLGLLSAAFGLQGDQLSLDCFFAIVFFFSYQFKGVYSIFDLLWPSLSHFKKLFSSPRNLAWGRGTGRNTTVLPGVLTSHVFSVKGFYHFKGGGGERQG